MQRDYSLSQGANKRMTTDSDTSEAIASGSEDGSGNSIYEKSKSHTAVDKALRQMHEEDAEIAQLKFQLSQVSFC